MQGLFSFVEGAQSCSGEASCRREGCHQTAHEAGELRGLASSDPVIGYRGFPMFLLEIPFIPKHQAKDF